MEFSISTHTRDDDNGGGGNSNEQIASMTNPKCSFNKLIIDDTTKYLFSCWKIYCNAIALVAIALTVAMYIFSMHLSVRFEAIEKR